MYLKYILNLYVFANFWTSVHIPNDWEKLCFDSVAAQTCKLDYVPVYYIYTFDFTVSHKFDWNSSTKCMHVSKTNIQVTILSFICLEWIITQQSLGQEYNLFSPQDSHALWKVKTLVLTI